MKLMDIAVQYALGKISVDEVVHYFPKQLEEVIRIPEFYTYGYAVVIPEQLVEYLNMCNAVPLLRVMGKNYICIKRHDTIRVLHYYEPEHLPRVGEQTMIKGNCDGPFGEGLYCLDMSMTPNIYDTSRSVKETYKLMKNRVATILDGEVDYLQCIVSNDTPKDNEILVLPHNPMTVAYICETQEQLDYFVEEALQTSRR